jgi:hypothetical protein
MGYRFDSEHHLHTLDGIPLMGTSTVVGVISKPLSWWASGLAVKEFGWTPVNSKDKKKIPTEQRLPAAAARFAEIKQLSDEEYLKLLDKAYRAHHENLDKTAEVGTDRHEQLEKYVRNVLEYFDGEPVEVDDTPAVSLFSKWASEHVSRFLISESHCYSRRLWTGGIVDLLFLDKHNKLVIMDFKSSRQAYLSQFFQIAGYDIAIQENGVFDSDGNLIYECEQPIDYYAVLPFGMTNPEPQFYHAVDVAKKAFEASVVLHKIISKN